MDNCLNDVIMTSSPIRFLLDLNTNRRRVYLSDIPNFILIENKRAKTQSREVITENYEEKMGITSL